MKARLDRHARYRELLAARLDRPLTRTENRLLVGHLRECLDCQQVERGYRDQGALLRSLPSPIPPRDMWARTSTALDREVSRWSYRYPRRGRKPIVANGRLRSAAPSALATAVAALGVVTVLAVLQLAPAFTPAVLPGHAADGSTGRVPRPTPFSVVSQPLTLVSAGETDFSVYETQVSQVCPTTAPDCFDDKEFVRRSVSNSSIPNFRPQNAALSPTGDQIAFVSHNLDNDVFAVVLLFNNEAVGTFEPRPSNGAAPTSSATAASLSPTSTPAEAESPTVEPSDTDPPADDTPDPDATAAAAPASPGVEASPADIEEPQTPQPLGTPGPQPETPPPSVVPGLTVLSILDDVHSAGAPPAWSRDSEMLAFSAMPADGSHGPDVYVWQPGDTHARAITDDHASFFASWSGRRVVASRITDGAGDDASALVTVVVDPDTLEERTADGPLMWLPVVDPQRANAIAWSGRIDLSSSLPQVRDGALYLVDWSAMDPFRAESDTESSAELVAIDLSRDPASEPVLDWHVRWSADGRVLGLWEADAPGASWGKLILVAFDPESGSLAFDDPLIGPQLSKRGFTIGVDRVAWIGPSNDGTEGELRIRTWGTDGVGDLRIQSLDVEGLVPSF